MHKVFFINLFVPPSNKIPLVGEVAERSKVLAWKASVPHKGTGGSNPFLSAQALMTLKEWCYTEDVIIAITFFRTEHNI